MRSPLIEALAACHRSGARLKAVGCGSIAIEGLGEFSFSAGA